MRIIIGLVFAAILPTTALGYCSEPTAPSCASSYGPFYDEWEFDRCKREMESYRSDVEDFIQCNNDEARRAIDDAQQAADEASSDYDDAVDSFNRRAQQ